MTRKTPLAVAIGASVLYLACSAGTSSGPGGSGVAGYANCTTDDQCPSNQGCTLDAPKGDGYCTLLCDDNSQCPNKYKCPSLQQTDKPDCDENGKHKGGRGICEMFGSSYGPNTCGSANPGSSSGSTGGTVIITDSGAGG